VRPHSIGFFSATHWRHSVLPGEPASPPPFFVLELDKQLGIRKRNNGATDASQKSGRTKFEFNESKLSCFLVVAKFSGRAAAAC
jgi:hypothetical protein